MAKYSRDRWPTLPTIADAPPSWLGTRSWQYLDAAWATYSTSSGDVTGWVNAQASAAGRARLGLLVGVEVSNGRGKYAMSASQLRASGLVLAASSKVCGLVLSRYDATYFARSDVKDAVSSVAAKARDRAATACRVR